MNKLKRGQVTIFIIVAIVLVVIVALYFVFRDSINVGSFGSKTHEVEAFVYDCIEEKGEKVIFGVALGGGHFSLLENSTVPRVTYYYVDGFNEMPSKLEIEEEISSVLEEKLIECTNNFIDFANYEIDSNNPSVETEIGEEKIYLDINYPIKITKGKEVVVLREFEKNFDVRFGLIYDLVEKFLEDEFLEEGICLTCLVDLVSGNDLSFELLDVDLVTTIFVIKDESSNMGEKEFEFVFANEYSNGL